MISVIVVFRNERQYLKRCIKSILDQSYRDFELILIDGISDDGSTEIAKSFHDRRIRYRSTLKRISVAGSRQLGLEMAKGRLVFFTDADCIAPKDWIAKGVKAWKPGYAGIEGKTVYKKKNPTISDTRVENHKGAQFMTCNMVYSREVLLKVGGFKSRFAYVMEDRDVAFRVLKHGKIPFDKEMLIYHQEKQWTPRSLLHRFWHQGHSRVLMWKHHEDRKRFLSHILFPEHLVVILLPPLLLVKAMKEGIRSRHDVLILLTYYLACVVERFHIWKTAIEERALVV